LHSPDQMILREKLSEKLTLVFDDNFPLEKYSMHDDKEIGIQIVLDTSRVIFKDESYLIMVKQFHPLTW
jgi:hypothetical protein